jgi:hypothetical protein
MNRTKTPKSHKDKGDSAHATCYLDRCSSCRASDLKLCIEAKQSAKKIKQVLGVGEGSNSHKHIFASLYDYRRH